MSSLGSAITPMSVPTGAWLPAGTRILRRTPEPNASISTSALSVSTSARMSPDWMRSPSCLSHLMILPISICSESLGITTLVTAMASVAPVAVLVADATDRLDDALLGGRLGLLEVARVRHGRRHARHALDRRVEVVEGGLLNLGGDLRAHAREAGARLDHDHAVGLAHRGQDGLGVHRHQRARIDDLHGDAVLLQLLGRLHRAVHHAHVGDDGDVG